MNQTDDFIIPRRLVVSIRFDTSATKVDHDNSKMGTSYVKRIASHHDFSTIILVNSLKKMNIFTVDNPEASLEQQINSGTFQLYGSGFVNNKIVVFQDFLCLIKKSEIKKSIWLTEQVHLYFKKRISSSIVNILIFSALIVFINFFWLSDSVYWLIGLILISLLFIFFPLFSYTALLRFRRNTNLEKQYLLSLTSFSYDDIPFSNEISNLNHQVFWGISKIHLIEKKQQILKIDPEPRKNYNETMQKMYDESDISHSEVHYEWKDQIAKKYKAKHITI